MFRKNKKPVLTESFCNEMETVRLSLEVLYGERVRFTAFDANTGKAKLVIGTEQKDLWFFFARTDLVRFGFGDNYRDSYSAIVADVATMRVIAEHDNHHKCGSWDMWWVGKSATDRWEEPLYLREAENVAKAKNLSLEEYLETQGPLMRKDKVTHAIELAVRYGGTDEMHHLRWVVDQMVRVLAGDKYNEIVAAAKNGEDGPDTYEWHVGIAP